MGKNSYERCVLESVDDRSLSKVITQNFTGIIIGYIIISSDEAPILN